MQAIGRAEEEHGQRRRPYVDGADVADGPGVERHRIGVAGELRRILHGREQAEDAQRQRQDVRAEEEDGEPLHAERSGTRLRPRQVCSGQKTSKIKRAVTERSVTGESQYVHGVER